MISHLEQQHRIGLLLEYSGGILAVIAGGFYIASLTVDSGSLLYQAGRRGAAVAILSGGLILLLGLATHMIIHQRELALAIAGASVASPMALVISIIHLDLWNVQSEANPNQELIVLYGVGIGLIILSLMFSVRKTTMSIDEEDSVPTSLSRKIKRLSERADALHADSLRARDAQYRTLATALAGIGISIIFLGILLGAHGTSGPVPSSTVTVLGGIGLFTGVFLYYVTPERFVTTTVVMATCKALDSMNQSLLEDVATPVYTYALDSGSEAEVHLELLPNPISTDGGDTAEELYSGRKIQKSETSLGQIVPTGLSLYRELEPTLTHGEGLAEERSLRLAESLNSPLGLVDDVEAIWESNRLSVRISNSTCGSINQFDHPVPSLLACGLAMETESKVVVETERLDRPDFDWQIVCRQVAEAPSVHGADTSEV